MPIELYLIDVKQKRTYVQKGDTGSLEKMVQRLISRLLQGQSQVRASTRPTSVAEAKTGIPKQTNSTPYKVAIFPFRADARCHGWNRPPNPEVASHTRALVQQNDSLTLAYSYYDESLQSLPISNAESVWGRTERPNAQRAYLIGKDSGVDVILTYWRSDSPFIYCSDNRPPYPVEVYLFDVAQQRMYRKRGLEKDLLAMTQQALSEFLVGVNRKVGAVAQREKLTTTRSAPYKIALFPFAGAFGGNSSWHREYKVAELLQVRIQEDRSLELVYSFYIDALNYPRINTWERDRPWRVGKPNVDLVYKMAAERNVDAVVMAFGDFIDFSGPTGSGGPSGVGAPIRIYVVDVARRKVYFEKGTAESESVKQAANNLLSQFLETHSTAMRKAVSAEDRGASSAK